MMQPVLLCKDYGCFQKASILKIRLYYIKKTLYFYKYQVTKVRKFVMTMLSTEFYRLDPLTGSYNFLFQFYLWMAMN